MCLPLPVEHPCGMSPEGPLFRAPLTRFQFRSCEFGHLLSGMRPGFANVRTDFSRSQRRVFAAAINPVSYTHLRAHETRHDLVCRLLLEKKKRIKETKTKS